MVTRRVNYLSSLIGAIGTFWGQICSTSLALFGLVVGKLYIGWKWGVLCSEGYCAWKLMVGGGGGSPSMFKYKKGHNIKTFGANSPHGPTSCVGQFAMWVISLHIHSVSINCVVTFLYLNIDFGSLPPLVPTLILGPHHHWYQFTMWVNTMH